MKHSWIRQMQENGMTVDDIYNYKKNAQYAVKVIPVIFLVTYSIVTLISGWGGIKTLILVSPFFAVLELVALITDKMMGGNELKKMLEEEYKQNKRKV